jgi:radial spoke head protein 9
MQLQQAGDFDEVLFWGRVRGNAGAGSTTVGIVRDYYIAIGLQYKGRYEFPLKKFYWTTGASYKFEPLPAPNEQHKVEVDARDALFFGEPEKVLIEVKAEEQPPGESPPAEAPPADPDKEKEQKEEKKEDLDVSAEVKPKAIPKNFVELDRLAYVVAAIENDSHVVPEGAFKLIPTHEIRRNEHFAGKS